jgi:hypothetical protein
LKTPFSIFFAFLRIYFYLNPYHGAYYQNPCTWF